MNSKSMMAGKRREEEEAGRRRRKRSSIIVYGCERLSTCLARFKNFHVVHVLMLQSSNPRSVRDAMNSVL